MKKQRKRHSQEFKKEVIEYSLSSSKSIKQICKDFGIAPSQYYTWKKQILGDAVNEGAVGERVHGGSKEPTPLEMADEIRRLRKQLKDAKEREDILKKAALILGTNPHNNMSS